MRSMILDHIVLRSPNSAALLADLQNRFGLKTLEGFKDDSGIQSKGVRFCNRTFLDVFNWPNDKPPFNPLLALEGSLAEAETIAEKQGWQTRLHRRLDIPVEQRPPWSTLSFRRGQGAISSVFVIEYEEAPAAWQVVHYRGDLYNRNKNSPVDVELLNVVISCEDESIGASQIDTLTGGHASKIKLRSVDGPNQIRIRDVYGSVVDWSPTAFDRR